MNNLTPITRALLFCLGAFNAAYAVIYLDWSSFLWVAYSILFFYVALRGSAFVRGTA